MGTLIQLILSEKVSFKNLMFLLMTKTSYGRLEVPSRRQGKHREVYTLEEGRGIYPTRILKMLKIFLWNGTNLRKIEILMQQTTFVLNWTRCTVLRLMTDHQNGELKLTIMPLLVQII